MVYTRIRKKNCTLTYKHINLHTYTHTQKVFFLAFVYRLLEIFTQKYIHYVLRMNIFKYSQTYIHILIFFNANVASRDLQRNASFQPTHLHHLAMLFIFEKIKKGDKQFFNMSVDLPNEFSNGIKLQLKIDQLVMRSAFSGQKKKPRLTNLHNTEKFQNKLLKVFCWTVRIEFFDI